jgi:hypothetical protein
MGILRMTTPEEMNILRKQWINNAVAAIFKIHVRSQDRRNILNAVFNIELEPEQAVYWNDADHATDDVLNQLDAQRETINECFDLIEKNGIEIAQLKKTLRETLPALERGAKAELTLKSVSEMCEEYR